MGELEIFGFRFAIQVEIAVRDPRLTRPMGSIEICGIEFQIAILLKPDWLSCSFPGQTTDGVSKDLCWGNRPRRSTLSMNWNIPGARWYPQHSALVDVTRLNPQRQIR